MSTTTCSSEGKLAIYAALAAIIEETGAIGKGHTHQRGYAYRGVDDFLDRIGPLLIKHRVAVMPRVLNAEHALTPGTKCLWSSVYLTVEYQFLSLADGSAIGCSAFGEGFSNEGKAGLIAHSAALKSALTTALFVKTTETDLGDRANTPAWSDDEPEDGAAGESITNLRADVLAETRKRWEKLPAEDKTARVKAFAKLLGVKGSMAGLFERLTREQCEAAEAAMNTVDAEAKKSAEEGPVK